MQCAGDGRKWGQSPVDIDENNALGIKFPALVMSGHWNQDGEGKMRNTGKTVQITLEGKRSPATIQGGPLANDVYELSEVVFRWGSSNCKGAEHTLNGTWFTMEAQAIHFNRRYEKIENCMDRNDGLAICTYFLQVYQLPTWDEHPLFSKITDNLYKITTAYSTTKLPANCLSWMRQACQTPGYYTYLGSTTTFPFHESVTWIVFPEPVRISENQAQLFRLLRDKDAPKFSGVPSTSSSGLPKWRQSPIDLCKSATWTKKFPPLYLTNYWSNEGTATMTNTGKTVTIEVSNERMPTMRGGPLSNDEFQFMNVQFRWGPENSLGAEHTIDGIWYSMEAQIMHWNTRYGSIEKCFDKPDGIAILSYLMQVVGCPGIPDNPALEPITNNLAKIKRMGHSTEIPSATCLLWMLEACMGHGYYAYPGSLTVPPYSECVYWIISSTITKISTRQIDAFRGLYTGLPTTGQSPIDIKDSLVRPRKYPPLVMNGHWLNDGEARLVNTGHTAKIVLSGDRIPSTVCGGPLASDEYEFVETHFHWGEDNCRGAEHTINGTWYSMESHAVHWNRKYGSFEECQRHKDGICILSHLFLVQPGCCDCINPQLERITENLKNIVDADSETKIPSNSLCWMRWATYCTKYYTYPGSWNVGDYPECVIWIVFPVVIPIRPNELKEFRKLRNKDGRCIKSNWRETQFLKCRKIFAAIPN